MDVHINTISIDFLNNSGCFFCNMFITLEFLINGFLIKKGYRMKIIMKVQFTT